MVATASPTLKVPLEDFTNIVRILKTEEPAIAIDNQRIKSKQDCKSLKLSPIRLSFSSILDLSIPPFLYTQTLVDDPKGYRCLILVEENQEDSSRLDSISTQEDGLDYQTNNGYILGAPALQSFMVLLDFEKNRIGLAQKVNNFGATLLSRHSKPIPDDGQRDGDHHKPPIHTDNEKQMTDGATIPGTTTKQSEATDAGQSSYTGLVVFVLIMVVMLSALLAYAYYRKKRQRTHPTFAKTLTPQEKAKEDERREYRENVTKQRKERRASMKKQREERRSKYDQARDDKKAKKAEEQKAKKEAEAQKKDEELSKRLLDESLNNESIEPIDESDAEGSFAEKQVTVN